MHRLLVAAAGASVVASAEARAQLRAEAEVGGAVVTQPGFEGMRAATLRGTGAWDLPRLTVEGSGVLTLPSGAPARALGAMGAAWRVPLRAGLRGEIGVGGSAYHDGAFPTAVAGSASARVHAGSARLLGWLGGALGSLDDQVNRYPLGTVDAGVAARRGRLLLQGVATWHATQGEPRVELPDGRDAVTVRDPVTYTDVVLTPRLAVGALQVSAHAGLRIVHQTIAFESRDRRAFGGLELAWWATPAVGIVASMGRDLSDLARALPESRYASLAARIPLGGRRRTAGTATAPRITGAAPDVLIETGGTGGTTLRVLTAAAVQRVEIAATFTQWEPIALRSAGPGAWEVPLVLPSGPHRLLLRVDGGPWVAPANLPSLADEDLGGRVGVVTVP